MRKFYGLVILLASIAVASFALALETARMDIPEDFERHSILHHAAGFGGWNKGNYHIGEYTGSFTRGESRLGIFDPLYVSSKGKGSFTFSSALSGDAIDASCRMSKGAITVGMVTFDPKKMNYQCDFHRNGALMGHRFVLGQAKPANMKERFLAKDLRKGEAILGDHHLSLTSVHKYRRSAFTSQAPLGYLVHKGDTLVAAIELTDWNPTLYVDNSLDDTAKESVLIAALAVAVLRDPADSALED